MDSLATILDGSEAAMTLSSDEFAITLADGNTYVVTLSDTTSNFHLKTLSNASIQTSVDNAAELYGAAHAIKFLRNENSGAIAQTINAWNDSLAQIGTVLLDKGILTALQTTAAAAIVSFTGGPGAVSIVGMEGMKDAVTGLSAPVAELAFAYKLIKDAESGLSQLTSQYQQLLAPGNIQPVSLTTITNLVNNTLSALNLGAAALKIADSIPGVLNGSIWEDILDFGTGIADKVLTAFTNTLALPKDEVELAIDSQKLNTLSGYIADIPDWVSNASAFINYVNGSDAGSYYKLLTIDGLNDTANGPLASSPAIAPPQVHSPAGTFKSGYSITPTQPSASESQGLLRLVIHRTDSTAAETLLVSTVPDMGTSNPNGNFYYRGIVDQAVPFAAGVASATVDIAINDVHLTSGSESFHVIAQDSTGTQTLASQIFTIVNDDPIPKTTYSISIGAQPFSEHQGTATIVVTRSGGNVGQNETVYLSTVHDLGTDNPNSNYFYLGLLNRAVTFIGNATSASVPLQINDVGLASGSESFRLVLMPNTLSDITSPLASATFTIANSPVVSPTATGPTVNLLQDPVVLRVGNSVTIDAHNLDTYENGQLDNQLQYTIVPGSGPSHGSLLNQGVATTSFTQADIDAGHISYSENGSSASSDSFVYSVSDSANRKTANMTFNIQILPAQTGPVFVDTNAALAVATQGTFVISHDYLHVTDPGVNSWQIIYTLVSGPSGGTIVADGSHTTTWFTQQQLDLGLISYQNTSGIAGADHFAFTMSDGVGGTIGQTTFNINVVAPNNLHLVNNNTLTTHPNGSVVPPVGSNVPSRDSIITSQVLSTSDPGVSPQNITYHIVSQPTNDIVLLGSWGTSDGVNPVPFIGTQFSASDVSRGSFTQADINAGRVFYQSFGGSSGDTTSLVLSANDNIGNSISTITVPVTYVNQPSIIYNGVSHPFSESVIANITAAIGGTTTVGNQILSQVWQPLLPSQIKYSLWFAPQHGALLLNGVPLVPHMNGTPQTPQDTFSQDDIDQGRITYEENGDAAPSDEFGIYKYNVGNQTSIGGTILFEVGLTGKNGGTVAQGSADNELLPSGLGSNYFFGDGSNTIVSYALAPAGIVVDLGRGTAQNGFGGTDTLKNIFKVSGSPFDDTFLAGSGGYTFIGGGGTDVAVFSGSRGNYSVVSAAGSIVVSSNGQLTTLSGVALTEFANSSFEVLPGHVASGTEIASGGALSVVSGSMIDGIVVDGGGLVTISAGGTASGTIVSDGGHQLVQSGGTATGTVLMDPGVQIISSGGVAFGTIISAGEEDVFGTTSAASILSGGLQAIFAGGLAEGSLLFSGGTLIISGIASGTVNSGGNEEVFGKAVGGVFSAGNDFVAGVAIDATISAGAVQNVFAGGVTSNSLVLGGAQETVFVGGTASNTLVSGGSVDVSGTITGLQLNGGAVALRSGAAATGVVVAQGGQELVVGGAASGTAVSNASFEVVFGGSASGTIVSFGGQQYVSGGLASNTALRTGAIQRVFGGGVASGTTVELGGYQLVFGGQAHDVVLSSGAQQRVDNGGSASGITLSTGASQIVFSGAVINTSVATNAFQYLSSGATATSTSIAGGSVQWVFAGATAISNSIASNAYQAVTGTVSVTSVGSGSIQYVFNGGSAVSTTISNGAVQYLLAGATAISTTIQSGGYQTDFGTADFTTLSAGTLQFVELGAAAKHTSAGSGSYQVDFGSTNSTTLAAGGLEYVLGAGATASNVTGASGSLLYLDVGTTLTNATLSGGMLYDYGSSTSATITGAGALAFVFGGGSASALTIGSGAAAQVNAGAGQSGGSVLTGSLEYIIGSATAVVVDGGLLQKYGSTTSITIQNGGEEVINAGVDSAARILTSGLQVVSAGTSAVGALLSGTNAQQQIFGSAIDTTVEAGGADGINAGGHATGTVVSSGGSEFVFNGGTATGTQVESGGKQVVLAGGTVSGATIDGGLIELQSGSTASSSLITISSGTLKLDDSVNFSGSIAGLATSAQVLDLADIDFSAGITVAFSGTSAGGTLTVQDGTHTANLLLIGNYLAATFTSASDNHNGTLITDPPVSSGSGLATPH